MPSVAKELQTMGVKYVAVVPDNKKTSKTIQGVVL